MNSSVFPKCASDAQMIMRTAFLFRSNVYVNDCVAVLTFVLTAMVMKRLNDRTIFSNSTHVLIWISLCIVNAHEVIYGYIQNWSLYRSFVYSSEPCNIMFDEYECFPSYTANIFVRLLMLFTNCALTTDRLLTLLVPCIPASYSRGIVLFLFSLGASVIFCMQLTSDGPTDKLQNNCFQRMDRNMNELKSQLLFYFKVCSVCFVLNCLAWFISWRALRKRKFNLQDDYTKRESVNSALVISLILVFQVIALGFYSLSVVHVLDIYPSADQIVLNNLVLWFYTYPWASLSLPVGILMSTRFITIRRRHRIDVLTAETKKENQTSYFIKLHQSWDDAARTKS